MEKINDLNPDMSTPITQPSWEDFYLGSRKFQFLADSFGLPIDQMNFLLCQFLALLIAYLFRVLLHPKKVSASTRHWTALSAGLFISYFCFGKQVLLAICLVILCYCLLLFLPFTTFHHATLIVSMMYLSAIHIQRQFYADKHYAIDITGPLMIIVQKATSLAYSLHDGLTKDKNQLTKLQKKFVISAKPTALEYFSYLLCFHSILAGPYFMYMDYQDFIHGTQFIKYEAMRKKKVEREHETSDGNAINNNYDAKYVPMIGVDEPSPMAATVKKIIISLSCALVVLTIWPMVPITYLSEKSFLNSSSLYKVAYILLATSTARHLYYTAWFLADAVCTMSGLGFNGYSDDGLPKWDLVGNVDIIGVEFGTNLRTTLESWNIGTMMWLRFLVYERAPVSKTLLTYILSSIWHGFYPGYYLTFLGGAYFTIAARIFRRCVRPHIVSLGPNCLQVYHFFTWLATRLSLSYITFPFVLLRFWESLQVYISLWFYLHILVVLTVQILPIILPPIKREVEEKVKAN